MFQTCRSAQVWPVCLQLDLAPGRVSKRYLDRLVMNLFIVEGYKDAAKAFAKESGIERESALPR